MEGKSGKAVPNQFIIDDGWFIYFQSYKSIIVKEEYPHGNMTRKQVFLDRDKWDYSKTTGKYRNQFLGETRKETEAKIKSGEYILADLN